MHVPLARARRLPQLAREGATCRRSPQGLVRRFGWASAVLAGAEPRLGEGAGAASCLPSSQRRLPEPLGLRRAPPRSPQMKTNPQLLDEPLAGARPCPDAPRRAVEPSRGGTTARPPRSPKLARTPRTAAGFGSDGEIAEREKYEEKMSAPGWLEFRGRRRFLQEERRQGGSARLACLTGRRRAHLLHLCPRDCQDMRRKRREEVGRRTVLFQFCDLRATRRLVCPGLRVGRGEEL